MNPFDKEPSTVPTLAATPQTEVPQCMQQPPNNGTSGLPPPTTLSQRPTILPQPTTLNRQPTIPLTHPITPTGTYLPHFRPRLTLHTFPRLTPTLLRLAQAPIHANHLTRTSSLPYYSSYYYNGYITTITSYLPCPTSTVVYYTQECPENCPTTVINPDDGTTTLTEYVSTPLRSVRGCERVMRQWGRMRAFMLVLLHWTLTDLK